MSEVTVFMPVYNAGKYLREAVDSILEQTYKDFKFLIIDDGSVDNSRKILEEYKDKDGRIRLESNDVNKGVSYTRNRGLELCDTDLIAFMDADDIAVPERLETQVKYLKNNPGIIGVGGYAQDIDEDGKLLNGLYPRYLNPRYIKANMILENCIANGSVTMRMDVIRNNNIHYLDNHYGIEDYRFYCECLQYGMIANINMVMQKYRIVSSGLTVSNSSEKKAKRDEIIDSIHEYNFAQYGFEFSKKEKYIIKKVFREDGRTENEEELNDLYFALQSMANQAEELDIDISKEIKIMCRKQFGNQVSKAFFLWENLLNYNQKDGIKYNIDEEMAKAREMYGKDYEENTERVKGFLNYCTEKSLKVAVWGAGLKGLAFLQNADAEGNLIKMMIDKSPVKWDVKLPTGHIIKSPEAAISDNVNVILVVNSIFYGDVWNLFCENYKSVTILHLDDILTLQKPYEYFIESSNYKTKL
ncbi:MAG: glycosyltransferase family 2 protein [Lachnospiraceae bacterium]